MLTRLLILDVVLIEKLVLDLDPGLNVFTGETGAGKSILLDALGLAIGKRGDAGLVRGGAYQASITAEFVIPSPHKVFDLAEEQGLSVDNPLILRRLIGKDGKSRAFVNDQPVSISLLKQFGGLLLEIHGQFDTNGLLDPASHRTLLDAYAGSKFLSDKVSTAYVAWREADERYKQALSERNTAAAEEDFLRSSAAELDDLNPAVGEAEKLALRRNGLQHREKILEALKATETALNSERGASATLALAGKAVSRIVDKAEHLDALLATIDRASNEVAEASLQLDRILHDVDVEPETLDRIEERLFAMRSLARKHNTPVDDLPRLREELATRLSLISVQSDYLALLATTVHESRLQYIKLAEELSAQRKQKASLLEKSVLRELSPLKLERAHFYVKISPLPESQWTGMGMDQVNFLATTNPGTEPAPLQKIASGGELARFMLALKVVLAANDTVSTLVFDEVDTGIGGATASAVGERLAQLAEHVQVLVVTHSPQVAARGHNHLRVLKAIKSKQASTSIEKLDDHARREEIARMLAGTQVTNAARQAAQSLLDDAVSPISQKIIQRAHL